MPPLSLSASVTAYEAFRLGLQLLPNSLLWSRRTPGVSMVRSSISMLSSANSA
ncbi:Uncharacterised protein [Bordetella pertussis]|nr:Uncharacterised protein [Bordetella pertussis]